MKKLICLLALMVVVSGCSTVIQPTIDSDGMFSSDTLPYVGADLESEKLPYDVGVLFPDDFHEHSLDSLTTLDSEKTGNYSFKIMLGEDIKRTLPNHLKRVIKRVDVLQQLPNDEVKPDFILVVCYSSLQSN